MNINLLNSNSKPTSHPPAIRGHIYMLLTHEGSRTDAIYLITRSKAALFSLKDGSQWTTHTNPFGGESNLWIDVTNEFVLQEI